MFPSRLDTSTVWHCAWSETSQTLERRREGLCAGVKAADADDSSFERVELLDRGRRHGLTRGFTKRRLRLKRMIPWVGRIERGIDSEGKSRRRIFDFELQTPTREQQVLLRRVLAPDDYRRAFVRMDARFSVARS
jgi:hypothetical protein